MKCDIAARKNRKIDMLQAAISGDLLGTPPIACNRGANGGESVTAF
jgi:hypothetical protein